MEFITYCVCILFPEQRDQNVRQSSDLPHSVELMRLGVTMQMYKQTNSLHELV